MLIDVAIPGDRIVIKKEAEKILKYEDLTVEIHRMWNVKAKATTVIRGATGTIAKSLRQYLSNITGKHEIKEIQKTAISDHTYYGNCCCKRTKHFTGEITLHLVKIVNTE
jgi:uncharacterized protein YycO